MIGFSKSFRSSFIAIFLIIFKLAFLLYSDSDLKLFFNDQLFHGLKTQIISLAETHQQIIPPEFTKNLKSNELAEGQPQTFECHVLGLPTPSVSWFQDEINIDNSPEFVITKINGACCLKIRQAQRHHSARYTCRALNPGGEATSSARLTVIRKEDDGMRSASSLSLPFLSNSSDTFLHLIIILLLISIMHGFYCSSVLYEIRPE